MMYCKLSDDGALSVACNPLRENGVVYSNASPETLQKLGYLPLLDCPRPPEKDGFWIRAVYELAGDHVLRSWYYEEGGDM
ncbi:MAG: hypothetical protein E7032_05525 [Akkermansiaceae bacterium]|nr:hypothetical protein [Akkermansiaceae bacterium]